MAEPNPPTKLSSSAERMVRQVGSKQDRMIRARGRRHNDWRAIAILGVIGWSVVAPTLIGVALGIWMDHRWPRTFSWTLMLLIAGLVLGCINAWLRVKGDQP